MTFKVIRGQVKVRRWPQSPIETIFYRRVLTGALQISFVFVFLSGMTAPSDFCIDESFHASCGPGQVVLMRTASYGRMRPSRCIVGDLNIGCQTNVVEYMHGQCSGRTECRVPVRGLVDTNPCQRDFVSFLEATFTCVNGQHDLLLSD